MHASAAYACRELVQSWFLFSITGTDPSYSIPATEWLFVIGFVGLIGFFGFMWLRHVCHMLPEKPKFQEFS